MTEDQIQELEFLKKTIITLSGMLVQTTDVVTTIKESLRHIRNTLDTHNDCLEKLHFLIKMDKNDHTN